MISFLLGSGFSYDEGIPGLAEIGKKFVQTKANDIYLGSDQKAAFLRSGAKDPNGWFPDNVIARTFFEDFIKFYCNNVIDSTDNFNYEQFIDYFYYPAKNRDLPLELKDFLNQFRVKYSLEGQFGNDTTNLLFRFYNIFSQLLALQLYKAQYFVDATYCGYPKYGPFIGFLSRQLKQGIKVNVHSLNHDMLFDFLGSNQELLWQYYCDGFERNDSPYLGELNIKVQDVTKSYKVKLKYYTGNYNKQLCFYKLHGSIDTYVFNLDNQNADRTRIKTDLGISEFYKEFKNAETGKTELQRGFQNVYPDFLSGTSYKLRFYKDPYYEQIHNLFKENISKSDFLIVIGYGFKDKGINEMIEQCFLKNKKNMIVIDPYPNYSFLSGIKSIKIIEKGLNEITHEEWDSMIY